MSTTDCTSRYAVDPVAAARFGTSELRANFLIPDLFVEGRVKLTYCHDDRMIIGGATPVAGALMLEPVKQTGTPRFLDRRELIAVNIGGPGVVEVNGEASKTWPPRHDLCRHGH